jgi:hypothetical protein
VLKVRRAQDAVLNSRPFVEALQGVFGNIVTQLSKEDIEVLCSPAHFLSNSLTVTQLPLLEQRPVKKVCIVVVTGDRGLCGSYNAQALKASNARAKYLEAQGFEVCERFPTRLLTCAWNVFKASLYSPSSYTGVAGDDRKQGRTILQAKRVSYSEKLHYLTVTEC